MRALELRASPTTAMNMALPASDPPAPLPAPQERALVERLRNGDERAYGELVDGYLPGLYRFAHRRLSGDRELAREVVQTTLCRVVETLAGYRGEAPLFTWLCACCRNEIAAHFRRRGRRPVEVALAEPVAVAVEVRRAADRTDDPEVDLLRLETAELVHAALDRLPPRWAQAVEWRYLEGLAVDEIAARLATSYKAAESLLSRARQAFRHEYEHLAGRPRRGAEEAGP